jgi:hypothetical protein
MAPAAVHQQVGEARGVGVQDLAGAVPDEVVRAADGKSLAVSVGDDERRAGLVRERPLQLGEGQGLFARCDDDVVQPRVVRDAARAFELGGGGTVGSGAGCQVVEGHREEPLAPFRTVQGAVHRARHPRQA